MHFGKCMSIVFQNISAKFFNLELKAGTELIPDDSTFQTMIVTKTVLFPIMEGDYYGARFYAMCGELHDAPPVMNVFYTIGNFADKNVVRLANYLDKNFIQNMLGQHALWAYTDKVSSQELITYGADSASLQLSADILNNVGIETLINKKTKVKSTKKEEEKQIDLLTVCLAGLSALFFTTTLVLLVRKKKHLIKTQ